MESQIQIQSETMEIVIPSGGGTGNVVDRTRQQRQQASPVTVSNASPGRGGGQQKHQQQKQVSYSA